MPLPRIAAALILLFLTVPTRGNWPAWRGPSHVGVTLEQNLPLRWDAKTKQNVLWKAEFPKTTGHSSPIVWGDRVFVTTAARQTQAEEKEKQIPDHHLRCFSAADGKELWATSIPPGKESMGHAIYASPTPCTDGKAVYVWFGSAVLAAVDFDGKILWRTERPGPYKLNPGIATSPILYNDTVLLLCDQSGGKGWLQAIDKSTGQVRWEQKREKRDVTNTTPVVIDVAGKPQLLIAASRQLEALNPATGELIWSCKARGFGSSPAYGSGLIFSDAGNGDTGVVVDPAGAAGDVTATHLKWQHEKSPSQYGSAVIAGDYVLRAHKGYIKCWNLRTGDVVYDEPAEGVGYLQSPIVTADGLVYFASSNRTYVVRPGPKLDVLAVNKLDAGDNAASAAVSNGKLFIRGNGALFCVGAR